MKVIAGWMLVLAVAAQAAEQEKKQEKKQDAVKMEDAVSVQIFLDRANFGPGKIDGRLGEFTQKAAHRYRTSQGKTDTAPVNAEDRARPEDFADLKMDGPLFIDYTVTEADAKAVGELPKTPPEQAKQKWLPYASVAEAVAERFHMDVDFLEELNKGKSKALKPGDVVKVVNVEPLELGEVKELKPGSALESTAANVADPDEAQDSKPQTNSEKPKDSKAKAETRESKDSEDKESKVSKDKEAKDSKDKAEPESRVTLFVSKDENMLDVRDGDKLIASFPVTVGSDETASPLGDWKVRNIAKWPNFRYDKKMLKEGERSNEFHLLPPGPNNPVGVVWIALNKKGVGIHGSDSPDAIGRNVSHGCIRLANWDIVKLASMVKPGTAVLIR